MEGLAASGVLVVDKPRGPTSHDLVKAARRVLQTRTVGHAGTLDPMATGVLILVVGGASKLSDYLAGADKTYRATIRFGVSTDSHDAEGQATEVVDGAPPTDVAIRAALDAERSRTLQVPPVLSAIHIGGERAYARVRRGEVPHIDPRPVAVRRLEVVHVGGAELEIELSVTKGYYVRALARDLGKSLSHPAHLSALRRIASGGFSLAEASPWPLAQPFRLISVADAARRALQSVTLTEVGAERARLGQRITHEHFATPDARAVHDGGARVAWMSPAGALLAIGEARDADYAVVRGFTAP